MASKNSLDKLPSTVSAPNKKTTTKSAVKPFTDACFTCKKRRVHCDMTRPFCNTCKSKNKLVCEGYDVKLRWSDPIEFDIYGDVSANPKNSKILDSDNKDPQYQRRKIKFLHYKKEYTYYEDMDDELSMLNRALSQYKDKIKGGNTWMIEKFGVFEGIKYEKILKKLEYKKLKNKKHAAKNKNLVFKKKKVPRKYKKKNSIIDLASATNLSKDPDFFTNIFQNINVNSKRNEFISPMADIINQADIPSTDYNIHQDKHELALVTNDYSEKYDRKHTEIQDKTEFSLNAYFEEIFKNNNGTNNSDMNNAFLNRQDDYDVGGVEAANIDIHKFLINDTDGKRGSRYDEGTVVTSMQYDHAMLTSDIKDLEKKKADLLQEISELLAIKSSLTKEVFE